MKSRQFFLFSILLFTLISCFNRNIDSVEYYGFNPPLEQRDLLFVNIDQEDFNHFSDILSRKNRTDGYLPKGASRYVKIVYRDGDSEVVQIIAGYPNPVRIVEKKV